MSNFNFVSHSYSYASNTVNGQTATFSEERHENPSGETIRRSSQMPGQAPTEEHIRFDSSGRQIRDDRDASRRIEDVTDREEGSGREQYKVKGE
jgi:hypothetical protein